MEVLEDLFVHVGIRAAAVSIDDFYLTFADQQQLAKVTTDAAMARVFVSSLVLMPCVALSLLCSLVLINAAHPKENVAH